MNEALEPVLSVIRQEPGVTLLVALGAYLLLFVLTAVALVRCVQLTRRQARLLRGADGASLERMLHDHIEGAVDVREGIASATERGTANAAQLRLCLQKIGIVRYDAFPDVGGEQSFSLALLDADDTGIVLSSLFSRHHMRVYAKPIERGSTTQPLTAEERSAIAASRTNHVGERTR